MDNFGGSLFQRLNSRHLFSMYLLKMMSWELVKDLLYKDNEHEVVQGEREGCDSNPPLSWQWAFFLLPVQGSHLYSFSVVLFFLFVYQQGNISINSNVPISHQSTVEEDLETHQNHDGDALHFICLS